MSFLLKLLVLVVGTGLAIKFGLLDQVTTLARQAAVQTGLPEAQVQGLGEQAFSLLSPAGLMAALGTLPPPFADLAKLVVVLMVVAAGFLLLTAGAAAIVRALRWMRDLAA